MSAPYYRRTFIGGNSSHIIQHHDGQTDYILPQTYDPGDNLVKQIEFALRYDGLDLALLSCLFGILSGASIVAMIQEKPTGLYRRKLWFLYEFLTGNRLPISDLKTGNYVELADSRIYVTASKPIRSSRHRIEVNLLGNKDFCPFVRHKEKISDFQKKKLNEKAKQVLAELPFQLYARAINYLHTKETKSSFLIEREEPDSSRVTRFVQMLRLAESSYFLSKNKLIQLQNTILDPRFVGKDYRDFQNFVGEAPSLGKETIHYVCPKPTDVPSLMQGLQESFELMIGQEIDPVICAAITAFGFVFIHPFEDGNGRIHRFLIHNILARTGYSPPGMVFPISASMLQYLNKYDQALESVSRPAADLPDFWTVVLDRLAAKELKISAADVVQYHRLPADFHDDPGDRFLVAQAISRNLRFLTADQKILKMKDQLHPAIIGSCQA